MLCPISSLYDALSGDNPKSESTTGTPFENIVIADEMSIPKNPHVIARGMTPNPSGAYLPAFIRIPMHSPAVDNMPNLMKLIKKGCSRVAVKKA